MLQWNQWASAALAIAFLGAGGSGCSEAPQSAGGADSAYKLNVADEASAITRREAATEPAERKQSPETQARIDEFTADARASLKRSADFLAGQEKFSFQADVAYDVLQPNGQFLEFGGTRDFLMRRPDRLRIESIERNGHAKQLYFDGTSLLVDMPNEDAYVRVEKPGTLYAAVNYLVDQLGAPAPLEDFISVNFAADFEEKVESGFYVQHIFLGEDVCEHLAFRTKDIDFQLWVRDGEEPTPCRLVITYKNARGQPQFAADFHHWNFAPEVDDELFTFEPPESAERLQVQAYVRELHEEMEGK